MYKNINLFFLICFSILFVQSSYSYNLKQITTQDNLSNNSITSICQDDRGQMWIGTCEGLNMYNGKNACLYQGAYNKRLTGNLIDKITETGEGTLWVQTYYGLNKIDRQKNVPRYFTEFNKIMFTQKDFNNNLFIIREDNLIHYYAKEIDSFEQISVPELVFNDILEFHIDCTQQMWIIMKNGQSQCYKILEGEKGALSLQEKDGYNHTNDLLYCFSDNDDLFFVDHDYQFYKLDTAKRVADFIFDLKEQIEKNGEIASIINFGDDYFIGFKTNGLQILRKNENDSYSVEKTTINIGIFCMLKDKFQDVVWIGTDGQGVYGYFLDSYSIRSILSSSLSAKIEKPIRALYLDDDNTMWIGSKGDGILKIYDYGVEKNGTDFRTEKLTIANSNLNDNAVYCISKSSKNILWIGNEEGLNYYSKSENIIKKVSLEDMGVPIKYIHYVYEDESTLWIASAGMGVVKADISWLGSTPRLSVNEHFLVDDGSISSNYFYSIYFQSDSTIWASNRNSGLFKIDILESTIEHVDLVEEAKEIYTVTEIEKEHLLIGTNSGLVKYNPDGTNEILNKKSGFANGVVHCILQEANGIYWLSTNRGIVKYNSVNDTFRTLDYLDGLNVVEFSDGAAFSDEKTGTLFFGGTNGFIAIDNNDYEPREFMPPVYFDELTIFGSRYNFYNFLSEKDDSKVLTLDYSQNFFSVSFTAFDYLYGNNYNYYYMLDGVYDYWIDNGRSNVVSFTNFSPGEYTLLVKYYNRVADKEGGIYSLKVKIVPPWYYSNWAYILYLLLTIVTICVVVRLFIVRSRNKRLQLLYKLEQEHKEDVYESKLSFFTNIAHEFCTPLTLIYGPCSRILSTTGVDKRIIRYAQVIQQNTERLNMLIQDLIEFRRIETGYKKPQVEQLELSIIMNQLVDSFSDMAETRKVRVEKDISSAIYWNTDKSFLTTICLNLLSNALKYTPEKGLIKVRVRVKESELHLQVSNEGRGIREEEIANIFDRHYILDNFENQDDAKFRSRNGLGLAISNSMITLLQGSISIESIPNKWTHFKIRLPYLETNMIENTQYNLPDVFYKQMEVSGIVDFPQYSYDPRKPTILIIDDELELLWFISDIFADDYNVIVLDKLVEVGTVLGEVHPDIILCDIMMPSMDGISFVKELKTNKETAHIPLILISAIHDMEKQIEGINAGAELYITKPFNVDYLKSSVRHLINRKEELKNYFASPLSAFKLEEGRLTHKADKKMMKDIINIINKNIRNKDLSVSYIADRLNMSPRNFYRRVKEISDISVADMIRDARLVIAEDLLMKSKLTVDEIIFKVGFANRVSFFKAFSKKHDCTPGEYRTRKV